MARVRSIRPTFWTDEKLGALPREVRLTFLGLISAMADDEGRCKGSARIVRGAIYPYDDDITVADVEQHLRMLDEAGRITRYRVNGDEYIHICNWLRHQKVEKPSASLLPPPPDVDRRTLPERSGNSRGPFSTERSGAERNGADGIGKERSGAERNGVPADSANTAHGNGAAPPAPLSENSLDTETAIAEFIGEFYAPYPVKRQRDVRQQLVDARSDRGARVKKGQFVRARDDAHLVTCIRAVIADPPRDPDAAIVLVLKKLGDPPPGPSPAEQRVKTETADRELEQEYQRERRRAGKQWADANPSEYSQLRGEIEVHYEGTPGSRVRQKAIDVELAQKCGDRAGFPPFEEWAHAGASAGGV